MYMSTRYISHTFLLDWDQNVGGRRCRDRMEFIFTTTCAIGAYNH